MRAAQERRRIGEGNTLNAVLFALLGVVAFVTVGLPGPARPTWFFLALGLTGFCAVLGWLTQLQRVPRGLQLLPFFMSVPAIAALVYSAGTASGLTPLFLLPALIIALRARPADSGVITVVTVAGLTLVGIANGSPAVAVGRSAFFWTAMLIVVSTTIHTLRSRLLLSADAAREQARQSAVAARAARELTVLRGADEVVRTSVELAAQLASPGQSARRAQYFRIDGDTIVIEADSDATGASASTVRLPLAQHPLLREVVLRDVPVNGALDPASCGPEVSRIISTFGITHSAYVPVHVEGSLHGVLSASGRGEPVSASLFEHLRTIANVTELALQLAVAHERLVVEAGTDPLTCIANRREFERAMERRSTRQSFAIIAIDVDGLKTVNDAHGHPAGDAMITAIAEALRSVARRGDTVARVGGDEFAVLATATDAREAAAIVKRLQRAVAAVQLVSGTPTVSVGVCIAPASADTVEAWSVADVAMYEAKRGGGNGAVIRDLTDTAVPGAQRTA